MDPPDRGHLLTERLNPRSRGVDSLSIGEAFDLLNAEDARVPAAVAATKPDICRAVELVADSLAAGGRLFYVGAGTSGRLGILDAAECPPTFQTDPTQIQGIIAGGAEAVFRSIEGAEDSADAGARAIDAARVTAGDVVLGIAAGGTTPFVRGALRRAKQLGAKTIFLSCVPAEQTEDDADVSIRVLTGPEVIAGSTRMKAGTATKLVLNTISTLTMVRLGKVFGHFMVDLNTRANRKLLDRALRIVSELTGLGREASGDLLERADGSVKVALVMHFRKIERAEADALLAAHQGKLSAALARFPGRPRSA